MTADVLDEDRARELRIVLGLDALRPALVLTPREIQNALRGRPVTYLPGVMPAPLGTVAGTVLGGAIEVVGIGCVETPHVVTEDTDPDRCDVCGAVKRGGAWRVS